MGRRAPEHASSDFAEVLRQMQSLDRSGAPAGRPQSLRRVPDVALGPLRMRGMPMHRVARVDVPGLKGRTAKRAPVTDCAD